MLDSPYPRVVPGPPRPSQILVPSGLSLHSGRERYEVQGNGALLIRIGTGDRVTVENAEGGQRAELVAADDRGRIDAGILGVVANSDAAGLKSLLAAGPAPPTRSSFASTPSLRAGPTVAPGPSYR